MKKVRSIFCVIDLWHVSGSYFAFQSAKKPKDNANWYFGASKLNRKVASRRKFTFWAIKAFVKRLTGVSINFCSIPFTVSEDDLISENFFQSMCIFSRIFPSFLKKKKTEELKKKRVYLSNFTLDYHPFLEPLLLIFHPLMWNTCLMLCKRVMFSKSRQTLGFRRLVTT